MSTLYSIGQMNQLSNALEAAGWTADDITKLRQAPQHLITMRGMVRGQIEIAVTKHTVNLDAKPYVPAGWKVEEHRQGGQFAWDPTKVSLHLEPEQQNGRVIVGHELRKRLENQLVLNANALDYLLANPELIPEEWKGKAVFFWGTIYRRSGGDRCVRCLCWRGGRRGWSYNWLVSDWHSDHPAAVLASPCTM